MPGAEAPPNREAAIHDGRGDPRPGVGPVYPWLPAPARLPRGSPPAVASPAPHPAAPSSPPRPRRSAPPGVRLTLLGLLLLALSPALGCSPRSEKRLPPEVVGVWKTADPKYADRAFELGGTSLVIDIGEGQTETYRIRGVTRSQEHVGTLYTVTYADHREGGVTTLAFYYRPGGGGVICLKNQPQIEWRREGP